MDTLQPDRAADAGILVTGVLYDIATNAPIRGVHVYQRTAAGVISGTTTNEDGAFILDAFAGIPVRTSHIGYQDYEFPPVPGATAYYLEPAVYKIPEVEITPEPSNAGAWIAGILAAIAAAWAMSD